MPRWYPTMVVLFQAFASGAFGGIVMSTMAYYLEEVSGAVDAQFFVGLAIALFSAGRIVSSYPLGMLLDRSRSTRDTLFLATCTGLAGNLLYGFVWLLPDGYAPCILLVVSRFIIGAGSSTSGVVRTYMAAISTPEQRTKYLAWTSLVTHLGLAISPGLTTLVSFAFPQTGRSLAEVAYVPAAMMVALNVVMLLMLLGMPAKDQHREQQQNVDLPVLVQVGEPIIPEDVAVGERDAMAKAQFFQPSAEHSEVQAVLDPGRWKVRSAYALFLLLNFTLRGATGIAETFGALQLEQLYRGVDISNESGLFFTVLGVFSMATFVALPWLERWLRSYDLLLLGIGMVMLGSVLLLPEVLGTSVVVFGAGMLFVFSLGSPICQTLTFSVFSQMLGSQPQGRQMAALTMAGYLGKIVFPLVAGISFSVAHWFDVVVCAASMVAILCFGRYFGIPMLCFQSRR